MTRSYEQEIEELLAQYRERRTHAGELQQKMRELTATAVSPRQTVKVSVGAQGDLVSIEFPTGAYKRMAPNELAEAILTTVREAKGKATEALTQLMMPEMPAGLNFLDLIQGKADLATAMAAEPPILDEVRDYVHSGRVPGLGKRDGDV
jgi:DNA-binding protein YbaB